MVLGTAINPTELDIISTPFSQNDNWLKCSWTCCNEPTNGGSAGTFSQTQTQTQTHTSAKTQTGITTQSYTETRAFTATATSTDATDDDEEDSDQDRFRKNQQIVLENGVRQGLTIGTTNCLDAANAFVDKAGSSETGEKKLERCQQELAQGKEMAAMARKQQGALVGSLADEDVLKADRSQLIFAKFEKLYGQPGETLVRHMLASGVDLSGLRDALKEKFGEEKAEEWMKDADTLKFVVELSKGRKSTKTASKASFRDSLRKAFEQSAQAPAAPLAGDALRVPKNRTVDAPDLTPMRDDPLFMKEETEEISLFQVVSRKYRENWPRMIPYRDRSLKR